MRRFYFKNQYASTKIAVYLLGIFIFCIVFPTLLLGQIEFSQIFPNTIDDAKLEYIELRNIGCEDINIGGYILSDKIGTEYIFPSSSTIVSQGVFRIDRPTSKIALNNTDETVYLKHPDGSIIDQFSYSTSTKGVVIDIILTDDDCTPDVQIENDITGSTGLGASGGITESGGSTISMTGVIDIGSGISIPVNTGGVETITGVILDPSLLFSDSGTTATGTVHTESGVSSSGILSTSTGSGISDSGITNSGSVVTDSGILSTGSGVSSPIHSSDGQTGSTSSGIHILDIIFPDIIPTIQSPTNALFSGGIFDCGILSPCRINITFDPIFTGGLLMKNYLCEIITQTGTLMTCNPNTLYYGTSGLLSFRLTSKIDPAQKREAHWNIIFRDIYLSPLGDTGSGSAIDPSTLLSGSLIESTGSIEALFPEIIPIFQNYTNTIQSGDTLTCTVSPCRVNFTLEPIFTGSYIAKNYACQIMYGTGIYNTCNPSQLYPVGTGSIFIEITHKGNQEKRTKTLEIIQDILPIAATASLPKTKKVTIPVIPIIDTNPPVIILEYDGKLKSYHEMVSDTEMNCYTLTCAINLTAEESYDPERGKLKFLWYYGFNDIKTTKDPGERKYGLGTHTIWLRVSDAANNTSSLTYTVHVLGPPDKETIKKLEKTKKISTKKSTVSKKGKTVKSTKKSSKKAKKIIFFDPPSVILQKSKFKKVDSGYFCQTTTKGCSINFTLSGAQKGIVYSWKYDNDAEFVSKNPRSKLLLPGKHILRVSAGYTTDTPLWTEDIQISVSKIKKAKKIKVSKKAKKTVKKTTVPKTSKMPISKKTTTPETKDGFPYTPFAVLIGITPIALLRKFFI